MKTQKSYNFGPTNAWNKKLRKATPTVLGLVIIINLNCKTAEYTGIMQIRSVLFTPSPAAERLAVLQTDSNFYQINAVYKPLGSYYLIVCSKISALYIQNHVHISENHLHCTLYIKSFILKDTLRAFWNATNSSFKSWITLPYFAFMN